MPKARSVYTMRDMKPPVTPVDRAIAKPMIARLECVPIIRPHLQVAAVDEDTVYLVGEQTRFRLAGRIYGRLIPRIDGTRSVEDLVRQCPQSMTPAEVLFAIDQLERRGYLTVTAPGLAPSEAAFWSAVGEDPTRAQGRLVERGVRLEVAGSTSGQGLEGALQRAGVQIAASSDRAELCVVAVEDYLATQALTAHRRARAQGERLLLCKLVGRSVWVGPVFNRPDGPCWDCLAERLQRNRPVETHLRERRGVILPPALPACTPGSVALAADLVASAVVRWLVKGGTLDDHVLVFDLDALSGPTEPLRVAHRVVRRPQCPTCGDPELLRRRAEQPIRLEPRVAASTAAGGLRAVSPEETYHRLAHHISAITGVVSSLGPLPDRDHPQRPVYGASYFVQPVDEAPPADGFHRSSAGKGRTAAQARTSALCEALERISAMAQGDEVRVRASYDELADRAVHPDTLQLFSPSQLRNAGHRASTHGHRSIPGPFNPQAAIDWTPAWSLTHACPRYVPTAYCYLGADDALGARLCPYNPNGHAAGNNREEATLQGLLELVERDAVAIWWYNRIHREGIELASYRDDYFDRLTDHYHALGWRLWALDITTDLKVPAVVGLARDQRTGRFSIGFGCHVDPRLAVERALTEVNQLLDLGDRNPPPWDHAPLGRPDDEGFLYPSEVGDSRHPPAAFSTGRDLSLLVGELVDALAATGLETLVLDQTRPDIDLAAVKVMVPGLRHFWRRLGPGRLYQVPVKMGWLDRPRAEADLNPVSLFL